MTRAALQGVWMAPPQAYLHGGSTAMKRLIFAGMLLLASGTASLADGLFWVVGNRATGKMQHRDQQSRDHRRRLVR
jgi:hypothetical protein